jgi:hypothetical protein
VMISMVRWSRSVPGATPYHSVVMEVCLPRRDDVASRPFARTGSEIVFLCSGSKRDCNPCGGVVGLVQRLALVHPSLFSATASGDGQCARFSQLPTSSVEESDTCAVEFGVLRQDHSTDLRHWSSPQLGMWAEAPADRP